MASELSRKNREPDCTPLMDEILESRLSLRLLPPPSRLDRPDAAASWNERVWTPPLLQALCLIAIRYDCLRVSGLSNDAVFVGIGP
jgi:hypothetical protein